VRKKLWDIRNLLIELREKKKQEMEWGFGGQVHAGESTKVWKEWTEQRAV
jgi:hypothetical protein